MYYILWLHPTCNVIEKKLYETQTGLFKRFLKRTISAKMDQV